MTVLYLCDGVCERADHHAPHPPQLLLVLHRSSAATDGAQHRLPKRQRRGGTRQTAAHQSLEALEKPAAGNTSSKVIQRGCATFMNPKSTNAQKYDKYFIQLKYI